MERKNLVDTELATKDKYMDVLPFISKYIKLKYALNISGLENIPEGPAMLVANHLRFDDSLIIAAAFANYVKQPLRLGAKSEYFEGGGINNKGLLGKPIQRFVENTQQIPVYREDSFKGAATLAKAIKYRFSIGESVLLHAEGSRSPDGRLHKFKQGAAAFAIKYGVPIVPVGISYDDRRIFQRTFVDLQFDQALMPQDYGTEFRHYRHIPDGLVNAVAPRFMKQSERAAKATEVLEARIGRMTNQELSGEFINPYAKKS